MNDLGESHSPQTQHDLAIKRHKTALTRYNLSRPLVMAKEDGLFQEGRTFFDYGCGRGSDVAHLRAQGFQADGYDPHFFPENPRKSSNIVYLGYVLNVIEDPKERARVLREAFALALDSLIVAVRTDKEWINSVESYQDGVLTSRGTFQKLFRQDEFKDFLQSTLEIEPVTATYGLAYLFKDESVRNDFLIKRSFRATVSRTRAIFEELQTHPNMTGLVRAYEMLGRLPLSDEFGGITELIQSAGSHNRLLQAVSKLCNLDVFAANKQNRRNEVLVSLLLAFLERRSFPKKKEIPSELTRELEGLWPSSRIAFADATDLLYSLGKDGTIARSCRGTTVGKLLPESLYVHRTCVELLPAELRVLIGCGELVVGRLPYDLVKIKLDGKSLSFLFYEQFDEEPHPRLEVSIKVDLIARRDFIRDYRESENRPILHRKELFVSMDYPGRDRFAALTAKEEAAGLLNHTNIGLEREWSALLALKTLSIRDYELISN